jgi:hypothetical protein
MGKWPASQHALEHVGMSHAALYVVCTRGQWRTVRQVQGRASRLGTPRELRKSGPQVTNL